MELNSLRRNRPRRPVNPDALRYRILSWLLRVASTARKSTSLLFAYVLGVWVNAFSDPDVSNFSQGIRQIYDFTRRPIAWATIVPTVTLIVLPIVRVVLKKVLRRASFAVGVSEVVQDSVDPLIADYGHGRIAWGEQIVLQGCPRIEEGWVPDELEIKKQPHTYIYEPASTEEFDSWRSDPQHAYIRDGSSLKVIQNPNSFTDDRKLRIEVQPTRFVDAMFYNRTLARTDGERRKQLERIFNHDRAVFEFPHSFCLHAVVCTDDGWILLTQRSPKVAFHPGTWSCSIEEQLSARDFEGTGGLIGKRWANRMLNEELGLTEAELDRVDVRFLALFLEVNNMNVSVAGLVTLPQDRNYLDAVIARRPRQDYEFAKWEFMRRDALAEELVRPSKEYHPSSGLRMFLAGIVKFGVYEFGVQIVKEATKKKRDFTDPGSVALSDAPPQS